VNQAGSGGPLALHWTGRSWRGTAVPFVRFGYPTGVFAVSRTNAWAVGAVFNTRTMPAVPLERDRVAPGSYPGGPDRRRGGRGHRHHWRRDRTSVDLRLRAAGGRPGRLPALRQAPPVARPRRAHHRPATGDRQGRGPGPGTPSAWSVGVGFTAGVDARARIERYAVR